MATRGTGVHMPGIPPSSQHAQEVSFCRFPLSPMGGWRVSFCRFPSFSWEAGRCLFSRIPSLSHEETEASLRIIPLSFPKDGTQTVHRRYTDGTHTARYTHREARGGIYGRLPTYIGRQGGTYREVYPVTPPREAIYGGLSL